MTTAATLLLFLGAALAAGALLLAASRSRSTARRKAASEAGSTETSSDERRLLTTLGGLAPADVAALGAAGRSRVEAALRESERRLATLVSNLPGVVYRCRMDRNWTMEYLSEGVRSVTGYPARDLLGGKVSFGNDLIHPDDRERVWKEVERAVVLGEPFRLTYRIVDAAGRTRWLWEQGRKIEATAGEPMLEGFIADITDRVRAEGALRESEERYRSLIEVSPDGIVVHAGGRILFANDAAARIAGYADATEVVGTQVLDLVEEGFRPAVEERIRHLQQEGGALPVMEQKLRRRDGRVVDLEVTSAVFNFEGRRAIQAIWRDIGDRKRAEAAVRASEEKYRRLFEDSRDAIFISTPEGQLLDVNQAAVDLFGFDSKEELLRVDIARDLYRNPSDREKSHHLLRHQGYVENLELRLRRRDGTPLTVLETATAVRDPDGRMVAFQGILRDVTARRQLERQLRQAQTMEAVGLLAGGIAHDFNNMLTTIGGYTDLLLAKLGEDHSLRHEVLEIKRAGKRAAELTRKLLTLSRGQAVMAGELDPNHLVRGAERSLRATAGSAIELTFDLHPESGPVRADPAHLEQALTNLVRNAREAMPGGGRVTVATFPVEIAEPEVGPAPALPAGRYTVLEVRDEGPGIPEEIRDRIFEPFVTTKEGAPAAGLGLATVYAIVQQAGGQIRADSLPGRGTVFRIYLPRRGRTPGGALVQGQAPGASVATTILLVEAQEAVREPLRHALARLGHRVLVADDGQEALELYRHRAMEVDLVVSDLSMGGIDGIQLARRLAEQGDPVRVLLMAGASEQIEPELLAVAPGATVELIRRPFTPAQLASRVRLSLAQG